MVEPNEPLSERELEILRLVATGAANKEIARQLVISPNTVKVHLRNIFTKIGVASRAEAMLYAIQSGLVKADALEELSPAAGEQAAGDAPGAALPGPAASAPPSRPFAGRTAWRLALLAFAVLVLLGAGAVWGLRLRPNLAAAQATQVAAQAAAQAVAQAATQTTLQQRWNARLALPAARKGMGFVEYESALYLIAGETAQGVSGTVLRYTEAANAWQELAHKPTPVTEIQAVVLGEKIYVPGGRLASGQSTNRLEVYNPRENTWEIKAPLPTPLSAYALAAFEGDLYLFGGKNGGRYLDRVYSYNPREDRWAQRSALRAPRAYLGAVTDGGRIILMGGADGQQVFALNEAYFPSRDAAGDAAWEVLAPLPQPRYGMGVAHLASLVYLVGGMDEKHHLAAPAGLIYNSRSNQWQEFDSPPTHSSAYPALLASGNFLYLMGGETPEGLSAANLAYQAIYTISVPILQNDKQP